MFSSIQNLTPQARQPLSQRPITKTNSLKPPLPQPPTPKWGAESASVSASPLDLAPPTLNKQSVPSSPSHSPIPSLKPQQNLVTRELARSVPTQKASNFLSPHLLNSLNPNPHPASASDLNSSCSTRQQNSPVDSELLSSSDSQPILHTEPQQSSHPDPLGLGHSTVPPDSPQFLPPPSPHRTRSSSQPPPHPSNSAAQSLGAPSCFRRKSAVLANTSDTEASTENSPVTWHRLPASSSKEMPCCFPIRDGGFELKRSSSNSSTPELERKLARSDSLPNRPPAFDALSSPVLSSNVFDQSRVNQYERPTSEHAQPQTSATSGQNPSSSLDFQENLPPDSGFVRYMGKSIKASHDRRVSLEADMVYLNSGSPTMKDEWEVARPLHTSSPGRTGSIDEKEERLRYQEQMNMKLILEQKKLLVQIEAMRRTEQDREMRKRERRASREASKRNSAFATAEASPALGAFASPNISGSLPSARSRSTSRATRNRLSDSPVSSGHILGADGVEYSGVGGLATEGLRRGRSRSRREIVRRVEGLQDDERSTESEDLSFEDPQPHENGKVRLEKSRSQIRRQSDSEVRMRDQSLGQSNTSGAEAANLRSASSRPPRVTPRDGQALSPKSPSSATYTNKGLSPLASQSGSENQTPRPGAEAGADEPADTEGDETATIRAEIRRLDSWVQQNMQRKQSLRLNSPQDENDSTEISNLEAFNKFGSSSQSGSSFNRKHSTSSSLEQREEEQGRNNEEEESIYSGRGGYHDDGTHKSSKIRQLQAKFQGGEI